MDMFLTGKNIKKQLILNANTTRRKILIASAFVKASAFEEVCKNISAILPIKPILIVRWNLNDLLMGVSDLEVYVLAKQYGWDLYIHFDLHAKIYNFDNIYMIGSSNLTQKGLMGEMKYMNIETMFQTEDMIDIDVWFENMIHKAYLVDDKLYDQIALELSAKEKDKVVIPDLNYSETFLSSLNSKIKLFTVDLFWSREPTIDFKDSDFIHDIELLELDKNNVESIEILKDTFLQTSAWLWLQGNLSEEKYYGKLTQLLHSALLDDPAPYRKNVKILLTNLLGWAEALLPDKILIDRPDYSQRVRLIC